MRAVKLIVFGVLGLLATLRGVELLATSGISGGSILQLALGVALLALFAREWKTRAKHAG